MMNKTQMLALTPSELRALADKIEADQRAEKVPIPLDTIDWSTVIRLAKEHVLGQCVDPKGEQSHDMEHCIYEEVMSVVYGKEIWSIFQ